MSRIILRSVVVASFLALVPVTASAQTAPPALVVGTVDLQRALNSVEDGQQARTTLEAEFERRQEDLATQQRELETFATELQASMSMLTEEAARERYAEYEQRAMALQGAVQQMQADLATAEAEATSGIFDRMVTIVQEIATERGYTLVLEKSTVIYNVDGMEFTDELIRRYDERF